MKIQPHLLPLLIILWNPLLEPLGMQVRAHLLLNLSNLLKMGGTTYLNLFKASTTTLTLHG